MPDQITADKVPVTLPVTLSIVMFDLTQGEEIFLSYTPARQDGPEIQRTGRDSPFMEHLYPSYPGESTTHPYGLRLRTGLIQEDLRETDLTDGNNRLEVAEAQGAAPEVIRVLQVYVNENSRLYVHDTEFIRAYGNLNQHYEIIGQQGCGDLTMNLWKVAYVNSPLSATFPAPELIFLRREPLANRTYSCLVKWKPQGGNPAAVTIEDVRFFANASTVNEKVWVWQGGQWVQGGDNIEFAVSSQYIIRNGIIATISRLTNQFSDLRHLLQMPNLNPSALLPGVMGDPERPRFSNSRRATKPSNHTDLPIGFS